MSLKVFLPRLYSPNATEVELVREIKRSSLYNKRFNLVDDYDLTMRTYVDNIE